MICRRRKPLALKLLLDQGRWNEILIRASKYVITEWRRTNATQQTRNQIYISLYIFGFLFVVWRWFFFTLFQNRRLFDAALLPPCNFLIFYEFTSNQKKFTGVSMITGLTLWRKCRYLLPPWSCFCQQGGFHQCSKQ